eukprot:CAMPEP_0198296100 /NCGR_PEP_ID=MMETSP1449-20131203/30986_1 /TAXON_ID=420275 /ORGANISM="Attheya septentrionalis, Strain CCMP2084" /LENGTH=241 /DNA_ID=CAMNT_0043996609 /DNA_START=195 /DNA_END=920 /DNA_ORIENTATION=+
MDTMESPSTTSDSFEDIASSRLGNPLCLTKQSVASAPGTLLRNVSISFKTMLNSQLSIQRVTSMLDKTTSKKKTKTRFPEAIDELTSAAIEFNPVSQGNDVVVIEENSRLIIPVVFNCSFGIKILGSFDVIHSIQTPGVFISTFTSPNNRLNTVSLELDTKSLVIGMKKKCEEIVQTTLALGFALNADVPSTPPCVKVRGSQPKTVPQFWTVEDERSDKEYMPPPPPRPTSHRQSQHPTSE